MEASPFISRWTTPGPREAVPCLAAGQTSDLREGAWIGSLFCSSPRPMVGAEGERRG